MVERHERDKKSPTDKNGAARRAKSSPRRSASSKVSPVKMKKLRNKLRAATYVGTKGRDLRVLFKRLDKNHSGTLSRNELAHGLKKLVPLTDQEMLMVWHTVDKDGSGEINIDEFMHFVVDGTKTVTRSICGG